MEPCVPKTFRNRYLSLSCDAPCVDLSMPPSSCTNFGKTLNVIKSIDSQENPVCCKVGHLYLFNSRFIIPVELFFTNVRNKIFAHARESVVYHCYDAIFLIRSGRDALPRGT